jgi:hypothetical protein
MAKPGDRVILLDLERCFSNSTINNLFSLPLMRKQPNYTWMLKNLLKLYCIWTWDTLWVFLFVCLFCLFCSILCIPFDETTTEQHLRHHLQDWRLRRTPKLLRLKLHCIWTSRGFFTTIIVFIYYFLFFILFYFIYIYITFISLFFIFILIFILFIFYFQSSLCLSKACSTYCQLVH